MTFGTPLRFIASSSVPNQPESIPMLRCSPNKEQSPRIGRTKPVFAVTDTGIRGFMFNNNPAGEPLFFFSIIPSSQLTPRLYPMFTNNIQQFGLRNFSHLTIYELSDSMYVQVHDAQRSGWAAPATKGSGNIAHRPRCQHEPVVMCVHSQRAPGCSKPINTTTSTIMMKNRNRIPFFDLGRKL